MPIFAYTARDASGAAVNGTLAATSMNEATRMLRAEGKFPISIQDAKEADSSSDAPSESGLKIARADVIQLSTQLAVMVETGVTLAEALECIGTQCEKPLVKKLVQDVTLQVQGGKDFSYALGRHPRSFPRLYVALIKAAEKSGMMSKLLLRATQYLRDEQEILRRVKGALTYPGIMLAFAVTTTVFLLTFVLPKFTKIYAAKAAALPLPTKILMTMSQFVIHHWMGLVLGIGTAALGLWLYLRTDSGQRVKDYLQIHIPGVGRMYRKLHLARSMRMVGTLAGAGVTLTDCVAVAQDLCSNSFYRELWTSASNEIQRGKQLSEPLFQSPLVPRSIAQMIHSGEKSGKLSHVLEQVATFSEDELKETITELTRYIEPAMIVIMGLIIGGVALALLLPIFTISRVVAS